MLLILKHNFCIDVNKTWRTTWSHRVLWFQCGLRLRLSRQASIATCIMLQKCLIMRWLIIWFPLLFFKYYENLKWLQLYISCFDSPFLAVLDLTTLQFRKENVLGGISTVYAPGMLAIGQGFVTEHECIWSLEGDTLCSSQPPVDHDMKVAF